MARRPTLHKLDTHKIQGSPPCIASTNPVPSHSQRLVILRVRVLNSRLLRAKYSVLFRTYTFPGQCPRVIDDVLILPIKRQPRCGVLLDSGATAPGHGTFITTDTCLSASDYQLSLLSRVNGDAPALMKARRFGWFEGRQFSTRRSCSI